MKVKVPQCGGPAAALGAKEKPRLSPGLSSSDRL
jgi:hypothetical protein